MSYHRFTNLREIFQGDLSSKLIEGVESRDYVILECNCKLPGGKCGYNNVCLDSMVIYQVECLVTGKFYIGNTQQSVKNRMKGHFHDVQMLIAGKQKRSDSYAKHFAAQFTDLAEGESRSSRDVRAYNAGEIQRVPGTGIQRHQENVLTCTDATLGDNAERINRAIESDIEAGIMLLGSEVKSLRTGKSTIGESYAEVRGGEVWLDGAERGHGVGAGADPVEPGEGHLARSQGPVNMIVVADTDVLSDRLWVQVQDFMGQPVYNAFANNGDFVYNAVDNLVGNADLIAVRTRTPSARPFTRVERIRRGAEERYRATEQRLQQQLDELELQLGALQQPGAEGQAQAISPAQQAEILRYQDQRLRMRKELREVQHRLNADIDALGNRLKLINILGMPALGVLVALLVAWRRWSRRRAAES